jgi:hypothetical protein
MRRKAAPKPDDPEKVAQTADGSKRKPDHEYGVGEMLDGTINIFPASEAPQRIAEIRALERAATEPDNLSDLDDIEKLFGAEKKSKGE